MNSNIIFNSQVTLTEVIGHPTNRNCKQIVNKTTGTIYASGKHTAKVLGVTPAAVYRVCNNPGATCKGNELEYLDHTSGNTGSLTKAIRNKNSRVAKLEARIAELEADAAVGRAIREAQEAKAKAKENAQTAYDKATAKLERRTRMVERRDAEYQEAVRKMMEAETEVKEAFEALMKLKED